MSNIADEAEIIEAAKKDPQAFALLYDRYFDRIYSYAYHLTGNHIDAEDVTAQTFKQAFENIQNFEWRGVPLGAWLYRIASNIVMGAHRRQRPNFPFEEALETPGNGPSPEDCVLKSERNLELAELVRKLPETQQKVILLRFSQGLSYIEIADIIGRTTGAVKQLIHRALVTLRENINQSN